MKSSRVLHLVSASCSILLLAGSTGVIAQSGMAGSNSMSNTMSGKASPADKHFVHEALMGGMAEVKLGQLASQKGASDDVKQFGQHMVEDHTKMGDQMKEVAVQIGVTPPAAVSPQDQALMTRLESLSGDDFDKAYIRAMVKDHEKDLKDFKTEAGSGNDPVVKDAANQGSEVISHHLEMIKQIAQSHNLTTTAKMN